MSGEVMDMARFNALRRALHQSSGKVASVGSTSVNGTEVRMVPVHVASHRTCGLSSDAMVAYAFDAGPRPCPPMSPNGAGAVGSYPYDAADLGACHETLRLAQAFDASGVSTLALPAGVVERMVDVYTSFWLWVVAGVNADGVHVMATRWHPIPEPAA